MFPKKNASESKFEMHALFKLKGRQDYNLLDGWENYHQIQIHTNEVMNIEYKGVSSD